MPNRPNNPSLGRRRFLGSLSAAAAAVPFLRSFPLRAETEKGLPRVLFVGFPNGPLVGPNGGNGYDGWRPAGFSGSGEIDLPEVLPSVFEPLSPHRDRLLFLEGMHFLEESNAHRATSGLLTGRRRQVPAGLDLTEYTSTGASIDQILAEELATNVLNTGFRVAGFANGESYWSYTGAAAPVTPLQNPLDTYERVFGEGLEANAASELLARRQSVLDTVTADLTAMKQRMPSEDRSRLEAHLDAVRKLETDLIETAESSCAPMDPLQPYDHLANANAPRVFREHAAVITQAFACGHSRIATLQLGSFGGGIRPQWPELNVDSTYSTHAICHAFQGIEGAGSEGLTRAQGIELGLLKERAFATLLGEVLTGLESTLDADGQPLLENTLVVAMRPMGLNHDPKNILFLAAGGAGVGVSGGRFMKVGDPDQPRYYNDLLTTISNTMGHGVDAFGDPNFCQTPIELG